MRKETKMLFTGIATLTGTVIGAGFLGIPYVVAKSGFLIGLLLMVVVCFVMMLVNLMIGEIALSTNAQHQLPGYASKYFGKKTKLIIFLASIFGLYSALTAYLLGEGESLSFIFTNSTNYSLFAGIAFGILMTALTTGGIKRFKKTEPFGVLAVFVVTLVLGVLSFDKINFENLKYVNTNYIFYPFGVILFSFLGTSAIPEMRRILKRNEKLMKKAIIIGSLIPLFVYALFVVVVLGLYGQNISEIATISFGKTIALLGVFTMFTAFLALNLALQDTYRLDFNISSKKAWVLSSVLPLLLFVIIKFYNLAGFVKILSIGGVISGGTLAIAIMTIHEIIKTREIENKMERKPEYHLHVPFVLKALLILLFILGIIYEII